MFVSFATHLSPCLSVLSSFSLSCLSQGKGRCCPCTFVPLVHLSLEYLTLIFIPLSRSLTLPTTDAFSCVMWPCRIPVRPQPKWRPEVRKTSGHASMPLSLAVHWELIGVTTPQQLQAQNRLWTFTVGPFGRGVKHAVPGALAAMCVRVCVCVASEGVGGDGGCGVPFSTFRIRDSWDSGREWTKRPARGQLVI